MFPVQTITQLSPNAAKLYLLFISLCNPADPMTRISRPRLAQLAAFSIRTCSKALVELRKLELIVCTPRRYHQAAGYMLIVPRATQVQNPAPVNPPQVQPAAPVPAQVQQRAPVRPPVPISTPSPAPKNPMVQPAAPLLNTSKPTPTGAPTCTDDAMFLAQFTPEVFASLSKKLTPAQMGQLLERADQALKRLQAAQRPKPV